MHNAMSTSRSRAFTCTRVSCSSRATLVPADQPKPALVIRNVIFATAKQVDFSLQRCSDPTFTERDVICSLQQSHRNPCNIPLLENHGGNLQTWCTQVKRLLRKTNSSALFMIKNPSGSTLQSWKRFWWRIFANTASHVKPDDKLTPRCYLAAIIDSFAQPSLYTLILSVSGASLHFQLDTGADVHVSGNLNDFSSFRSESQSVQVAGGGQVHVTGRGILLVPTTCGQAIRLQNAIHLPGQMNTLLSLRQLEAEGYNLRWPENRQPIELLSPSGDVVFAFRRENGNLIWRPNIPLPVNMPNRKPDVATTTLPPLPVNMPNRKPDVATTTLPQTKVLAPVAPLDWHKALGHPGNDTLKQALRDAGIKNYLPPTSCEICIRSKMTTLKGHSTLRTATSFGEVLHLDLIGGRTALKPSAADSSVPSATWFLLVVDEITSWRWSFPVYSKKNVPILVQNLLSLLHTQFGLTPKRLHTDRGTEFSGAALQELLSDKGIIWNASAAHAHEQNGIVERNVRTVVEKMRTLHLQSGLPVKYWINVLDASVYLLNRLPNKIAPKSPYYAVYGKLPDLTTLHAFGCKAFFINENAQHKLEPRATEGIYVGTHHNHGYDIFSPRTGKILTRRDVTFNEEIFPLQSSRTISVIAEPYNSRSGISRLLNGPHGTEWRDAMNTEIDNMKRNDVWTLVPRSESKGQLMTGRWVLRTKQSGERKARWCARGFSEPFADNTFADVLPAVTMRMLLALAASRHLSLRHVDVVAAFLNAKLDSPIYIEQPHGMEISSGMVCKLHKAIYGLKTAPRRWQETLRTALKAMKFMPLECDRNVFRNGDTIISTYVDDFMIIASDDQVVHQVVQSLARAFNVKDLGDMSSFLGVTVQRDNAGIHISHADKILALTDVLEIQDSRGASTPIADDLLMDRNTSDKLEENSASTYRSAVGSLLHIAGQTRPDIAYAVGRLARFSHAPTKNALAALKQLLRYLSRTRTHGLRFTAKVPSGPDILTASTDSSWSTTTESKGTSGNFFFINGTPIAWWSKKQTVVALSTCEAEYAAATSLAREAKWIKPLFEELFGGPVLPIATQIDNTAALLTAQTDRISARNRHFLIRESTVRDAIKDGILDLHYTPTDQVKADGLTKGLQRLKHQLFCDMINLQPQAS